MNFVILPRITVTSSLMNRASLLTTAMNTHPTEFSSVTAKYRNESYN